MLRLGNSSRRGAEIAEKNDSEGDSGIRARVRQLLFGVLYPIPLIFDMLQEPTPEG